MGRVPKHSPIPNLLFAWDQEDPSQEILGSVLSHCQTRLSFRPRPPRDCGNRASSRPAAPTSRRPGSPAAPGVQHRWAPGYRPRAAPAAADTRRRGALTAPQLHTARPHARSLTREATAASPLWLLSGFRTQAPTAAASTIPAADAGTAHPRSRVPSASLSATTCGGGPRGRGPLGRARSVWLRGYRARPSAGRRRRRDWRARGLGHFRVRPRRRRRRDGTRRPPAAAGDPSLGASPSSSCCWSCCCCGCGCCGGGCYCCWSRAGVRRRGPRTGLGPRLLQWGLWVTRAGELENRTGVLSCRERALESRA